MQDVIKVADQYYILATSSRADERSRVLKHGDSFGVFDTLGEIAPFGLSEHGIYHQGTRYLSRLELRLGGARPLLLSSTVNERTHLFAGDLTNPDLSHEGLLVPRGAVHVFRAKLLWEATCYERLRVSNFGETTVALVVDVLVGADFVDIFEVRGMRRQRRGEVLPREMTRNGVVLGYRGLDGVTRRTLVEASPAPDAVDLDRLSFSLVLEPRQSGTLDFVIACQAEARRRTVTFDVAAEAVCAARERTLRGWATIQTSNAQFNAWVNRSVSDLQMMLTDLPTGPYPYAGVPWFSTIFGRDGLITAMELLWAAPAVARGVLTTLALTQATDEDPASDAEPGKIVHEIRNGEMAALGEVPFARYYGTIDATPLFVSLVGAYYERTADRELVERLWPNVERALAWIERYGDIDGDGFIEYKRRSRTGLLHQGWKDSSDPISHSDGRLAEPPIALAEVQAYAYDAFRQAAVMALVLGAPEASRTLAERAARLARQFDEAFWVEEMGAYAMALDGEKRPCRVMASNAGQALFGGLAREDRASATATRLFQGDAFSGFGIRTLSAGERRYNPMSYHNGSVWPHDNAVIASALARYGMTCDAGRLLAALFEASTFVDLHRLPELFCGFSRRGGDGPTAYPVACAPQAWASGAVFLLLQASLGLRVDASSQRVTFRGAYLPELLDWVEIRGLAVGRGSVDLRLERHRHDVGVVVLTRSGDVEIVSTQ